MTYKITFTSFILISLLIAACSNTVGTENDIIPTTNIGFALQEPTHVKLWVENVYHTTVITLLDEERDAGTYEVSLEMMDSNGNRLPSGLYTYHLRTDSDSVSKSFILP